MIEIIRAIVEFIASAAPKMIDARKSKKLEELGFELFLVYFAVNQVLLRGEKLVRDLEHASKTGDPWRARHMLAAQARSLDDLLKALSQIPCRSLFLMPGHFSGLTG